MPVKRSRIGRSSSFGEAGFLSHVSPPVESADLRWHRRVAPLSSAAAAAATAAAAAARPPSNSGKALSVSVSEKHEESRPRILTFSSPDQESIDVRDEEPIGGFLERCYYCKKKIRDDVEVFMYSYLRAFCTAECRDRQIAMDNSVEEARIKSKEMLNQGQGMNNVKNQIGF